MNNRYDENGVSKIDQTMLCTSEWPPQRLGSAVLPVCLTAALCLWQVRCYRWIICLWGAPLSVYLSISRYLKPFSKGNYSILLCKFIQSSWYRNGIILVLHRKLISLKNLRGQCYKDLLCGLSSHFDNSEEPRSQYSPFHSWVRLSDNSIIQ